MNDYLSRISIMVVDDQDFVVKMMRQVLKVLGAQDVRYFTDAAKAWSEFKMRPTDLVILDWQMEPMDGLKLTSLIRKDSETPNAFVPVIMVTAYREKEHVLKARDYGVTEYVIKPVSPKGLFSRIEAVIERPRRFVRVGDSFFGPDRRRHKKEFEGEDRRGKGAPQTKPKIDPAAAAAERKREMGQEEINTTFNPDDVPVKEVAD